MVNVNSRSFEVTDAIKNHASNCLTKLEKYKADIDDNQFLLGKEGNEFWCELIIHCKFGKLFSKSHHHDLYTAITQSKEKLGSQLSKKHSLQ